MTATLKVDSEHDVMTAETAPAYVIVPGRSITLDGSGYRAKAPNSDGATTPTVVHIVHGNDEYYRAKWNASGVVTLSPDTLETLRGGPFQAFSTGAPYIIALGTEAPSAEKVSFAPMWTASVQVQEP